MKLDKVEWTLVAIVTLLLLLILWVLFAVKTVPDQKKDCVTLTMPVGKVNVPITACRKKADAR